MAVLRRHNGGEELRKLELSTRVEEGERELESKRNKCGVLWGVAHLLYGLGEGQGGSNGW
jgi:hypothetical protein